MTTDPQTGEIIHFRTPYNYNRDEVSNDTGLACPPEEHMTQQNGKEDADINEIVRRFGLTGELPSDLRMPVSGDFTGVTDFQTAMNIVRTAEEEFMRVPADLRARFNNDPARLMDFLADTNNKDEALKLGLIQAPREQTRDGHTAPLRVVVESTPPAPGEKKGT